jgi:uncharacterized protein (DUF433 family)
MNEVICGIEKIPGKCGGRALLLGTQLTVHAIESLRVAGGDAAVVNAYPYLRWEQRLEAYRYAFEHPEEMIDEQDADRVIAALKEEILRLERSNGSLRDEVLRLRTELKTSARDEVKGLREQLAFRIQLHREALEACAEAKKEAEVARQNLGTQQVRLFYETEIRLERATELLQRLEFVGPVLGPARRCPICGFVERSNFDEPEHAKDCELWQFLQAARRVVQSKRETSSREERSPAADGEER